MREKVGRQQLVVDFLGEVPLLSSDFLRVEGRHVNELQRAAPGTLHQPHQPPAVGSRKAGVQDVETVLVLRVGLTQQRVEGHGSRYHIVPVESEEDGYLCHKL